MTEGQSGISSDFLSARQSEISAKEYYSACRKSAHSGQY